MQSHVLSCCVCLSGYNKTNRQPKLVPSCGHTICLSCLDAILKSQTNKGFCPLDRIPFFDNYTNSESFPTNISLLQLLEERNQPKYDVCPLHDDLLNLICLIDGAKVCRYCVDFGGHKSHKVMHMNDIQSEAKQKIERLEGILQGYDAIRQYTNSLLEGTRKDMQTKTKKRFETFREMLLAKENEVCLSIENFFEQERVRMSMKFDKNSLMVGEIKDMIATLSKNDTDKKFFETLEGEERDQVGNLLEQELFKRRMQKAKHKLEKSFESLNQSLIPIINNFSAAFPKAESEIINGNKHCVTSANANKIELGQNDSYITNKLITPKLEPVGGRMKEKKQESPNGATNEKFSILKSIQLRVQDNLLMISSRKSDQNNTNEKLDPIHLSSEELQKVNQVTINSDGWRFSEDVVPVVAHIWKNLGEVTSLQINLISKHLTDVGLTGLCSQTFWATKSLQTFELEIYGGNVGDQSVMKLMGEAMVKMVNVKDLKVRLSETKITDKSIYMLADVVLPVMSGLKYFELKITGTQVTDRSIEPLCIRAKTVLKSAISLTLALANTKITDKSLEAFNVHILPALGSLERLELNLSDTKVNDSKIGNFAALLQSNGRNIKSIVLGFEDTKITDKNLSAFTNAFLGMPGLKDATINLKDTRDVGLNSIMLLEQLKSRLKINVSHNKAY